MVSNELEGKEAGTCPVSGHIDLSKTTLTDPEILAHPNDFYKTVRTEDPVHYDEKLGMYLISRYDDLQTVLRDPITFSVKKGFKENYAKGFQEELKERLANEAGGFFEEAIMTDPPEHTRARRLLDGAFTAHRVRELQPAITKLVADIIEGLLEKGEAEIFSDFAVPITSAIICEQLGVDLPSETIQRWALAFTQQISRMTNREDFEELAKELIDLQKFIIEQIKHRQENPSEDMISDLIHARAEGEENPTLSFGETVGLVRALLIAGNETTATALTTMFYVLATRPDLVKLLQDNFDDDRLYQRFVEELLRYDPPVRGLTRMTTKEVEVGGVTLPEGAHLLLLYASANDDETQFTCPRDFDVERSNVGRHMSFGGGVHRCAGAALARMELKVAAREIIRRMDNIKLAIPEEDIKYLPTIATHTISNLQVSFTRRS
ncbi:cytochrome P450 [Emcibacter nanhaiensis]|uniref:Cytochrome P450 n=1 Tax=Emcibacter nanhaiensis TaxID=1505037 RepID=A0A501PHD1_9PROT|nr:cytochrome P450 [Emcibacter nanhaiensis]TPD59873.1 cytochrome P450 [Emcibacter nanhaiensis]